MWINMYLYTYSSLFLLSQKLSQARSTVDISPIPCQSLSSEGRQLLHWDPQKPRAVHLGSTWQLSPPRCGAILTKNFSTETARFQDHIHESYVHILHIYIYVYICIYMYIQYLDYLFIMWLILQKPSHFYAGDSSGRLQLAAFCLNVQDLRSFEGGAYEHCWVDDHWFIGASYIDYIWWYGIPVGFRKRGFHKWGFHILIIWDHMELIMGIMGLSSLVWFFPGGDTGFSHGNFYPPASDKGVRPWLWKLPTTDI